jgi:formylglycine-generating enzyme required for sulfatase activity
MLRASDLADLGERLRLEGFRVSSQQIIAAQRLLLDQLRQDTVPAGAPLALAPWLAPIFCTQPEEQQGFRALFERWLMERGDIVRPTSPLPLPPPPRPRPPLWQKLVAVLVLLLMLAALLSGEMAERHVKVTVRGDGQILAGALVTASSGSSLRTVASGAEAPAALLSYRRRQLPLTVEATHPAFLADGQPLRGTVQMDGSQPTLEINLERPMALAPPPKTLQGAQRIAVLPPPMSVQGPPTLTIQEKWRWGRMALSAAVVLLPLLGWLAVWLRRRGYLQRLPGSHDDLERRLGSGKRRLLSALDEALAQLGRELRRRIRVPSRELDLPATIAATVRLAGIPWPVFGSHIEPEHLILVDRVSYEDHQACLANEIVATLHDRGVAMDVYLFDADPRRSFHAPLEGRPHATGPQDLGQLHGRHPDSRLIMFSDGRGLIDMHTGLPAPWVDELLAWERPVLVTPQPRNRWATREWLLERAGIAVLPLDADGLRTLGGLFGAQSQSQGVPAQARDRSQVAYVRDQDRLLDPIPPAPSDCARIISDLRRDLGADGFAWLAGCAVYPEINWGITLRIGDSLSLPPGAKPAPSWLIQDEGQYAQRLMDLARTPWMRHGFMPDWLREALLARMPRGAEQAVRQALDSFLQTLQGDAGGETVRIATPARPRSMPGDIGRGLLAFLRRQASPPAAEDRVFLRFMSGRRPPLAVDAGEMLRRLLYRDGVALAGPNLLPLLLALVLASLLALLWPPMEQVRVETPGAVFDPAPQALALDGQGTQLAVADSAGSRSAYQLPALTPLGVAVASTLAPSQPRTTAKALGFGSEVQALAESANGRTLVVLGTDGKLLLRRAGAREFETMPLVDLMAPLALSGDGLTLAVADASRAVQVWRLEPGGRNDLPVQIPPSQVLKDCSDCPEMVVIPAGSFDMGSPENEKDRYDDEGPVHRVTVRSFALAKTEVTQGQWRALMGSNPSHFKDCGDNCPVEQVSWNDAQEYVKKLSAKTGKTYRLPSEAEWEYAARAGTRTRFHTGDCLSTDQANYDGNYPPSGCPKGQYRQKTLPVASLAKNGFGLYDMHGNVWEWVQDCRHSNYNGAPTDGSAWEVNCTGVGRVLRGGSWNIKPQNARSAIRYNLDPSFRDYYTGFRPARTLP